MARYEKEREVYEQTCSEVAEFVGMPKGSLILEDMLFDKKALFSPKFLLEPDFKNDGEKVTGSYKQRIRILPLWRRVAFFPLIFFKNTLEHECRHAVHYALINKVYDSNPVKAHRLIMEEKPGLYKVLQQQSIRPGVRRSFAIAEKLLENGNVPKGSFKQIEKASHFASMTYGLKESFADKNNILRNGYFAFAGLSGLLLINGVMKYVGAETGTVEVMSAQADVLMGSMASFASMVLLPRIYYRGSRSLTPKNLERFTPTERKFILAFPSDYKPLEQRCQELKNFGFPL